VSVCLLVHIGHGRRAAAALATEQTLRLRRANIGVVTHAARLDGLSWQQVPAWLRLVLVLTAFGLVGSFHRVVRGAVEQGDLRRKATAASTDAHWRCMTQVRGPAARMDCFLRLNSASPTWPPPDPVSIATAIAPS
jgi:hypothetical protein